MNATETERAFLCTKNPGHIVIGTVKRICHPWYYSHHEGLTRNSCMVDHGTAFVFVLAGVGQRTVGESESAVLFRGIHVQRGMYG